ncbi:MAG TPA: 50S ribosomal protein L15 [Patescibacteria group bacterium]|nr:50S ribosomal protein L15 [Patescibacteria group bacterium]
MKLNQLKDNPGARQTRILVGRGIGSGKGKTAGRGVKGQKARTGVAIKGFEGGQSPLLRRMPKRGFNNFEHATHYAVVTLGILQSAIDGKKFKGDKIDAKSLREAGLIDARHDGVKLVGSTGLKSKATIVVTKATKGAIEAVEKAGGKVEVLPAKVNKLLKPKKAAKK